MRLGGCVLLSLVAMVVGGCNGNGGAPAGDNAVAASSTPAGGPGAAPSPSKSYTLELIFQGLATFSQREGKTWVFLGNTTDVTRLRHSTDPDGPPVAAGAQRVRLARHFPRLLVPHVLPAGVTVTATSPQTRVTACHPSEGEWEALDLSGVQLTLAGPLSPDAEFFDGGASGERPCTAGSAGCTPEMARDQEQSFRWVRKMNEILQDGRFGDDLYQDPYAAPRPPPGRQPYPVLAARFVLDKGSVRSASLHHNGDGSLRIYRMQGVESWGERAVASLVKVQLQASGPVQLMSRTLSDGGAVPQPLLSIDSSQGETLKLLVVNDPGDCVGTHVDWVMSYNYLRTRPTRFPRLLGPAAPPPDPRGSCSPDGNGT